MEEIIRAAAYFRWSCDDPSDHESNSIANQRKLAEEFVEKNPEFIIADEYVDDGWSGTNLERPDFKRMMDDAEKGKINCIISKDLSRIGRNYILMGRLTQKILPKMGIRLISINDEYDSAKESANDMFMLAFKNIFNDYYSKDLSMKIRSSLDVKRRRGEFIGSYAAYGYKKDENNHNHLVPDEYAANVVRDIFKWKMEGLGCKVIADKLNENGVLPPIDYHKVRGVNIKSGFLGGDNPKWGSGQVWMILRNRLYIGTMQQGKCRKVSYKLNKLVNVPREEWICVENTHEAIIDPDVFERVQELMEPDTCTAKKPGSNIFGGIARCGDCGENMIRSGTTRNKKLHYLNCCTYVSNMGCSSHFMAERNLSKYVLDAINGIMKNCLILEDTLEKSVENPYAGNRAKGANEQIAALDKEITKCEKLKNHLCTDLENNFIGRDDYNELNKKYTKMIKAAKREKVYAETEIETADEIKPEQALLVQILTKYRHLEQLDRRAVVELIDRIDVKDKEHITVHFRFNDPYAALAADEAGSL